MTYTSQEISRINSSKSARQGELYIQDNGLVWVGTYAKTLSLRSGNPALPAGASTIEQLVVHTDLLTELDL